MALGADDPLLFGSRLAAQYDLVRRHHAFTDEELAELARQSVRGSAAPSDVRSRLLAGVDDWLAKAVANRLLLRAPRWGLSRPCAWTQACVPIPCSTVRAMEAANSSRDCGGRPSSAAS